MYTIHTKQITLTSIHFSPSPPRRRQDNIIDVIRHQEFQLLPVDEVSKLLASDDLNVPNEETIFHAMILWANADRDTRKVHLARLLRHVKLPLLTPQVSGVPSSCLAFLLACGVSWGCLGDSWV